MNAPVSRGERDERAEALVPMVRRIARRVARMIPSADVDDLIGDGYVGLMRAIDAFDPARGTDIDRYAARVVTGAMINGVRKREPVSIRVRHAVRFADRERFRIANAEGRLPSVAEMERLHPELRAPLLKAHRQRPVSLNWPLPPGERLALHDEDDPEKVVIARTAFDLLIGSIEQLPDRLKLLVSMHYFHDVSIREIGERLAITPQRASQLHRAALAALRSAIES